MSRLLEYCPDCEEPLGADEAERGLCEECLERRERDNLEEKD